MTKNKKKKQPVIPQRRKNEELRAVLEKYFPGALQAKNGGYVVNSAMLQDAISPEHGKVVDEGFELRWVGKKEAYHHAYTPNDKILKPLRADSADFDGTRNILIKGDNLDALKLLGLNYFEQVKVIYIDPPYNTGKDGFVYNDNYTKSQEKVLDELGYSPEQKEHVKGINGDATHSGWLNFMRPRLLLASDLLAKDGIIFISIDDNEVAELKMLCDEVFGQSNFLAIITWQGMDTVKNDARYFSSNSEFILCYAKYKNELEILGVAKTEKQRKTYKNYDNDPRGDYLLTPLHAKTGSPGSNYTYIFPNGQKWSAPEGRHPSFTKENLDKLVREGRIYLDPEGKKVPQRKTYWSEARSHMPPTTFWGYERFGSTRQSNAELRALLGRAVFDNPKPVQLIKSIAGIVADKDAIVMDFFAGSATTGQAVMELNAEDGGKRKFILVQLPEEIDPKKSQAPHDFVTKELGKEPTIFEIAAERLRRAGKKVRKEWESQNGNLAPGAEPPDTGFRVFEIAADIHNEMYHRPLAEVEQGDLAQLPIDSPHDDETILCNMLLGTTLPLDTPIQEHAKGALYQADVFVFVLGAFSIREHYRLLNDAMCVFVYEPRIKDDKLILELRGNFGEKVKVKGRNR